MALDPRIALMGRVPDVGATFSSVLDNLGKAQKLKRDRALLPIDQQITEANLETAQVQQQEARQMQKLASVARGGAEILPLLEANDIEGTRAALLRRRTGLIAEGLPTETTDEGLLLVDTDPELLKQRSQQAVQLGQQFGFLQGGTVKDTRTSQQKNFEAAQQDPAFGDFLSAQNRSKATNINTTISNANAKGLTEEQKALAKSRVGRFENIQNIAQSAMDQNEQLSQIKNIDVESGVTEPAKIQMARVFNALGANGDDLLGVDVANAQSFNAVSGKLLAEALAAQKGPQTDNDATRMMNTLPKIDNEQDANRFIVSSMQAINDRKIEQAEFYENILDNEGTLREADKKWRTFKRKTPMLSATKKNKATGLPLFFNDFLKAAMIKNPTAKKNDVIEVWRKLNE